MLCSDGASIRSEREKSQDPGDCGCWVSSRDGSFGLRRCSNSKHPASSAQGCPHADSRDAWLAQESRLEQPQHCHQSSRCWCGSCEDAPTRGRIRSSGRRHDAVRHRGGSGQARRGEPASTSAASRRCHRTSCSGGGAGRSRRALRTTPPSILWWSRQPKEVRQYDWSGTVQEQRPKLRPTQDERPPCIG